MKSKLHVLSATAGLMILGAVGYQNCSKVVTSDTTNALSSEVIQSVPSRFSSAVVGTSDLADLKMLFVVDNSYTMKQNNINLAQSFPSLFNSQNSDNLARFSVTSSLITVAQRTPAATLTDQARLNQLLAFQASAADSSQLSTLRQGDALGRVAGDSIGYSVSSQNGSFGFEPAFVLGTRSDGSVSGLISKASSESPTDMVNEFKSRLTMLQGVPLANYEKNSDILDRESGLCALARVLRSPASLLKSGDLPVFGIFTDEDDSDADGKSCLASYTYSEGNDSLIDGVCETRKTSFSYQISVQKPAQCQMSYQDTFNWSLSYKTTAPSSTLNYYKLTNYSCPVTQFDFQTVSQWLRKKTSITVSYKTYKVLDGVKVYSDTVSTKNLSFNGSKTEAECQVAAQASLSSTSEQYVSNICSLSQVADSSCGFSDSTCVIGSQSAKSLTATGDFTSSCDAKAKSLDGNAIAGTISCKLTGSLASSATSISPSCTPVVASTATTLTDIAKDLSSQSSCDTEARNRGGYVSASYPATCTMTMVQTNATPKTGSLSLGTYASVTATGACPADVQMQILNSTGVTAANVVSCSITSLHTGTNTQNLTADSCATQAANFCKAQPAYRNCQLVQTIAPSTSTSIQSLIANEDLKCDSKCSDSQTGFCKPTAQLATVSPTMTIAEYLTQAQGAVSVCSSAAPVTGSTVSSYNARLESQKAGLCVATSGGLPVYNRVTKGPYHLKGLIPDYVSGNKTANDGSVQPAMDLPTYVLQRSQELFGKQTPIVNVFIRTANDPVGDAGSRGLAYERLATMMNGNIKSVLSPDYSSALQDLSSIIKSQMMRSFKVPNMKPTEMVVNVTLKAKSTGASRTLASTEWSQAGQTVQLAPAVSLNLGDELQFEFK